MSHSPYATHAAEEQAPFAGHPFGGLPREDRFGVLATFDNQSAQRTAKPRPTPSGRAASTFTSVSIRDFDQTQCGGSGRASFREQVS